MSSLAKLAIKTVSRQNKLSPIEARRNKLLAAIAEQMKVAEAATRGEQYVVTRQRWTTNEAGEKVCVERQRAVRSWFFAQDGGFYVQCKYGARALDLTKDGNAIFVKAIGDIASVLETLRAAVTSGELDSSIQNAVTIRKTKEK